MLLETLMSDPDSVQKALHQQLFVVVVVVVAAAAAAAPTKTCNP